MTRLLGVVVALLLASAAYGDDAGTDDMATPEDASISLTEDASATMPDMAHRPNAAKASLPGCAIGTIGGGGSAGATGAGLVLSALLVLALRPRVVRVRRTARRRR